MGVRERLIAERAEDAEAAIDAAAGNGGIDGPGFGEEAGDGNRVGDDLQTFAGEQVLRRCRWGCRR